MLGSRVRLADGTVGTVLAEWWAWQDEHGLHHGHRLRVEIARLPCSDCPHGPAAVVSYTTVDAGDVYCLSD